MGTYMYTTLVNNHPSILNHKIQILVALLEGEVCRL